VAAARTPTANLLRAVGFATAVLLVATGCGGTSANYVHHEAAQTYFKVPKEWDVTRIVGGNEEGFLRGSAWRVFFAPKGTSPEALNDPDTSPVPLGQALIGQIEQGAYDQFTDLRLRAIVFYQDGEAQAVDPIELLNSQDDDVIRVLGLEQVDQSGLRGYKLRYQIQLDPSMAPLVYEQTTVIHDATHTYYSLSVVCPFDCFVNNVDDISEIFESLRVRRDQP
jgi:hypothetical protein